VDGSSKEQAFNVYVQRCILSSLGEGDRRKCKHGRVGS